MAWVVRTQTLPVYVAPAVVDVTTTGLLARPAGCVVAAVLRIRMEWVPSKPASADQVTSSLAL